MSTEAKVRKNPDYSASAVNLHESVPEVELLLAQYHQLTSNLDALKVQLREKNVELYAQMDRLNELIADCDKKLRKDIEEFGSWQRPAMNWYAVQSRSVSKSYDPVPFEKFHPEFVPAVIVKAVDIKKLEALVKGGLLVEDYLKKEGVITESETFKFIIR